MRLVKSKKPAMSVGARFDENAARLAAVASITEEALVATDALGAVTEWNAAAEQLFGYAHDEMIGRPFASVVEAPPADADAASPTQIAARRKDGAAIAISLSVAPILDAQGERQGAVYIARDPGARARAERAATHLSAIVESSDDAIVSKDLDGVIVSWNRAAEQMFGYTAAEAVGRSIRMLIPEDRQAEEDDVLARIRRGARVDHFETIRRRKDGSLFPISLTISPILDGRGRVVGASKIARDISERRRLEEGLRQANRLKDEFLATLSHELRTPLNAILGYANMIKTGAVAAANQRRAIDTIERNARALAKLVGDVLDVSRVLSGKMRLHVQDVEIGEVIQGAIDAILPAAEAKGVAVETAIAPDLGLMHADTDRLQQIAWNLLSNAVKFTGRGGRVRVEAFRGTSTVELVVRDSGVGIAPAFLPHVFERFRQGESGMRRPGGLGLGLSITKQLIELHGGTITAESEGEGKGATFSVTLPV